MLQLTLLAPAPPEPATPAVVKLTIEPVPDRISLGDRYFLVAKQGDRSWLYPLQLTEVEVRWLLPTVEKLDWSLGTGFPADLERIHALVERRVDGGAV